MKIVLVFLIGFAALVLPAASRPADKPFECANELKYDFMPAEAMEFINGTVKNPGRSAAPDADAEYSNKVKVDNLIFTLPGELCETMSVKQIIKKYGDSFFDCYNDGYKKLDMFVEIKDDVKKQILDQFEMLINKEFFSVLVDESDRVVAFTILTPAFGKIMKKHDGKTNLPFIFDVLKYLKNPDKLETTLGAVRSEFLKKGYNAPCFSRMMQKIDEHNIDRVCSLPTLETNTAVRAQWNAFESKIIKQRQTYIKNI